MTLSNGDAKKEIAQIISGLSNDGRLISSFGSAFKIVASYPLMMAISYIILLFVYCVIVISNGDNTGQSFTFYYEATILIVGSYWVPLVATIVLTMLCIMINFSTALVYVSIPEDIRNCSRVLSSLKSGVKNVYLCLWGFSVALSLIGIFNDWLVVFAVSIPSALFISIFIINGYLGVQSARYGLGTLMSTAKMVLNKQKV